MSLWMSLHRPPHQLLWVLATLLCIHISNQTFRRRRLTYLAALSPLRNAAADPPRVFPVEWPPLDRGPDGRANEVLRELAILYLREPNSQVAVIRMEPGHAHGVRVVITLDLAAGL
jgi:hypothetical protein